MNKSLKSPPEVRAGVCALRRFMCSSALLFSTVVATSLGNLAHAATDFVAAKPAQRVEYWQRREAEIDAYLREGRNLAAVRLVFLGDSITDFWQLGDNPWVRGQKFGQRIWHESFSGEPAENLAFNLGISGDRTEHVLYRLLPRSAGGLGELDSPELDPEYIILLVPYLKADRARAAR
jgi:hypothetical protein